MKKLLSCVLFLSLCLFLITSAFASEVIGSGYCGYGDPYYNTVDETCTWTLQSDGTLTIEKNPHVEGRGETHIYFIGTTDEYAPEWLLLSRRLNTPITKLVVGEGITSLNRGLFGFNAGDTDSPVREIRLPSTLTGIDGTGTLSGLRELTEVYIPEGTMYIAHCAFSMCTNLKILYLPSTIKEIWVDAFYGCAGISDIYFGGTEAQWETLKNDPELHNNYLSLSGLTYYIENNNVKVHFNAKDNHPLTHLMPETPTTPTPKGEPSPWAVPEMNEGNERKIVPESFNQNPREKAIRVEAAEAFVLGFESVYKKSIDKILSERRLAINPNTFSDTNDKNVLALYKLGIVNGVGGGKFAPEKTYTRAEVAAMLTRFVKDYGINTDGYSHPFKDAKEHWVSPELGWLYEHGIAKGISEDKFAPNEPVTKEQTNSFLLRTIKVLEGLTS